MRKNKMKTLFIGLTAFVLVGIGAKDTFADEIMWDESDEILQAGGLIQEKTTGTDRVPRYLQEAGRSSRITVDEALYTGLSMAEDAVDLTGYNLKPENLKDLYVSVLNSHADLFYVDRVWSYSYSSVNGVNYITKVYPEYLMEGDELAQAKEEFYTMSGEILAQVQDNWSDLEKAMFLHDYICNAYEYDTSYKIYDAYQFMKEKKGVCQAYTELYGYLLKQCGISVDYASSTDMNHIWNLVFINGSWYHVDVTWDDPLNANVDIPGRAGHNCFMRSDAGIASSSAGKHYGWVSNEKGNSETYENAFWSIIDKPFVYENNQWYCMYEEKIQKCTVSTATLEDTVYTITDRWTAGGSGYWTGAYSGFGGYNDLLYFNTPDALYSYDTESGIVKQVYSPTLTAGYYLYGFTMLDNEIRYAQAASPNEVMTYAGVYTIPEEDLNITVKLDDSSAVAICLGEEITPDKLKKYFKTGVTVYQGSSQVAAASQVATGDIIHVESEGSVKTYQIAWKGDVNGDGNIDVTDMEAIQKDILGIKKTDGVYFKAARLAVSGDDELSVLDMEQIQKYLLGFIKGFADID